MNRTLLALALVAVGIDGASLGAPVVAGASFASQVGNCPIATASIPPFSPPAPYPVSAPAGMFWHGNDDLWTRLPIDGSWRGLPVNGSGFRQKVFWWHPGFDGGAESRPEMTVTGRRLDGAGSFVRPAPATNASHADFGGWTILTLIDVPTTGCWELAGSYRGNTVSFVVSVTP
jgi:hypothetical protein